MRKTAVFLLSCFSLATIASSPAVASDLQEGAKLYAEGNYSKALPFLQRAAKFSPMSWQTHYYLANTNLALGRMGTAKYEYELCLKICNKPDIIERCREGLARAEKHSSQTRTSTNSSSAPAPNPSRSSSSANDEEDEDEDNEKATPKPALTDAQRVINHKKEEIMRTAKNDCARIKKAATEQIEEERANANQYWQDEDGKVFTSISPEREAEIHREAEAKCRRVMEDAQRRLGSLGN
ncbi:hypothetical protein KF913_04055 [Candidatus Obscuribacterales bacterium]|nr:hypothetical protein [Candidatus Obscuribacterales bacterium]